MGLVGRSVVRHRKAVLVFWFLVALAGIAMVGTITSRLFSGETLPGLASYTTSQSILRTYGTGGDNPPDVIVLRLRQQVESTAGRAELNATLAPLDRSRAFRVVSYANSDDGRLVSADGHSAVALVFGNNNEPTSYDLAARRASRSGRRHGIGHQLLRLGQWVGEPGSWRPGRDGHRGHRCSCGARGCVRVAPGVGPVVDRSPLHPHHVPGHRRRDHRGPSQRPGRVPDRAHWPRHRHRLLVAHRYPLARGAWARLGEP